MKAIAEIAGRDSFVAAIKFCGENRVESLYPTFAHTGTEYGGLDDIRRNVDMLRRHLQEQSGTKVEDLRELGDYPLWHALNGRFMAELTQRYGFFTPCIGCHLYVHLVRIPLAGETGVSTLIAGEREFHEAGQKMNQTSCAIDAYQEVMASIGIDIVFPVRKIKTSGELMSYAGWLWEEGGKQPRCVLSGNYRPLEGQDVIGDKAKQERFARSFIIKAGRRLAAEIAGGGDDYLKVVEDVLREKP